MDLLTNEPKIDNDKNKKIMKLILIVVAILVVISIVLVCLLMYMQSNVLKISVDGNLKEFDEGFFVFEDNTVYVPIKDFAKQIVGYDTQNGEYQKNTEDKNKCYIESINEIAMFSLGSNVIYKTMPNDTNYERFTIEHPVKNINNQLYISIEGISIACNVKIYYLQQNNQITIQTLPKLVTVYTQSVTDKKYGYTGISEDFSSQKAILQDLIVVVQEKENTKKYGVINTQGEVEIGTKYDNITFIESTKEFLVTNNNKVGILSANGDVKISLDNDELQLLDNDLRLYLATSNGKKGVLDEYGKIVLHKEYDEIGIDSTLFPSNNIENRFILFDNAIPVKKDGKYGLYNIKGEEILPLNYSGFGYVQSTTKEKSVNNLLIIPEYEGIVLSIEYEEEKSKKYGIVNSLGEEIVPFGLDEIYSVTSQGKDEYKVVYRGGELSLSEIKFKPTSTTNNKNDNEEFENKEEKNNNTNSLNEKNTNTTNTTNTSKENQNSQVQENDNSNEESNNSNN